MARRIPVPGFDAEGVFKLLRDPVKFDAMRLHIASCPTYPNWEYVKYHTPEPWRPDEYWQALLLVRSASPIAGLKGDCGRPMRLAQPEVLKRRLHEAYSYMNFTHESKTPFPGLDEKRRRKYLQRSLREEAISSSQMEGAATTRAVAREMLRTGRSAKDESEQMIINNFQTMERLREWKNMPLSVGMLLEMQSLITKDTIDEDERGRFRRASDSIVVEKNQEILHRPPPAEELEERLRALINFANHDDPEGAFYYPLEKAAILHFMIGYVHPFCNGNGRTARALFYWYLLRSGCWIVEFFSISKLLRQPSWRRRYEQAYLDSEDSEFDLTYFVLMQIECFIEAAKSFNAFVGRVEEEQRIFRANLGGELNDRQLQIIAHMRHHPGYDYTAIEHAGWNDISLNTARADLEGLRKGGYLRMRMVGKTKTYNER